jgi:tRNA dimethylallyltransferase
VQRVLVICGPTASGKTALAIEIAGKLGAEIVSADSQQCYRGLDAGTAKPTAEERARVAHHLLDVADPEEQLDAARFVQLADGALTDIRRRGKRAIVAGGTGLWIRALLRGLLDAPGASPEFREALREEFEREGVPALHERLRAVDPAAAAKILPKDRVLRARIEARTRRMFEDGSLRRETEWLLKRGATKALKIIGYAECAEALRTGDWALAQERTNARTWQYARRQRTWFARDAGTPLPWPYDAVRLCEQARRWYEGAPP